MDVSLVPSSTVSLLISARCFASCCVDSILLSAQRCLCAAHVLLSRSPSLRRMTGGEGRGEAMMSVQMPVFSQG